MWLFGLLSACLRQMVLHPVKVISQLFRPPLDWSSFAHMSNEEVDRYFQEHGTPLDL